MIYFYGSDARARCFVSIINFQFKVALGCFTCQSAQNQWGSQQQEQLTVIPFARRATLKFSGLIIFMPEHSSSSSRWRINFSNWNPLHVGLDRNSSQSGSESRNLRRKLKRKSCTLPTERLITISGRELVVSATMGYYEWLHLVI